MVKEKFQYQKYVLECKKYQKIVDRIASLRMVVFLVMLISFILKAYYAFKVLPVLFIISLLGFICLIFLHDKYYKIYDYYSKYVAIIETYLARETDEWKQFLDTGADFIRADKACMQDLDILGTSSLFQYLTICKTMGGRARLAEKLSNLKVTEEQLKREQEAIGDITEKLSFVVNFQVNLLDYAGKRVNLTSDFSYLEQKQENRRFDFVVGILCSCFCLLFLVLGIFSILPYQYFWGMFCFNFLISLIYATIFRKEFGAISHVTRSFRGLRSLFLAVIQEKFSSTKMLDIQKDMDKSIHCLEKLGHIDTLNSLKSNFLSNLLFNGLFSLNLLLLYRFSKIFAYSLEDLKKGIFAVEELEAMISVASLGIVREDKCMPIMSKKVVLSFSDLRHPLVKEEDFVANDFSSGCGVQIITGSNMGGKTSFLRTIGINTIMMNAGGYVCAKSYQASYFKIFTCMRIADDTLKGISTFYGELLRIKEAIDYGKCGNRLVLIDEIFKGTNYQDRIFGAKEVIRKLNNDATIAFITTHDFELCDSKRVFNYHVKEYYEDGKICFDYKIRKGKCVGTNAKYLMKELGIIETDL